MFFKARKVVLKELQQDRNYEIVVLPFNSQGEGPASPPSTVYVGEAVPTGEPRGLEGEAVSSTEVRLRWKPPQQHMQNGELLGYKVRFLFLYALFPLFELCVLSLRLSNICVAQNKGKRQLCHEIKIYCSRYRLSMP